MTRMMDGTFRYRYTHGTFLFGAMQGGFTQKILYSNTVIRIISDNGCRRSVPLQRWMCRVRENYYHQSEKLSTRTIRKNERTKQPDHVLEPIKKKNYLVPLSPHRRHAHRVSSQPSAEW